MFNKVIKWGLLALFVIGLTSCSFTINNRNNQSIDHDMKATTKQIRINNNQNSTQLVRILEQDLSFKINNVIHQKTAFLKYNDNQNYSMYVLPDYELIVKEPTQDLLYFVENEAVSMRIELLSDDVDWKLLTNSTYGELTSLYNTHPIKTSLRDNYFGDLMMQEVHMKDDIVTTYFINHPEIKLKLTMNTKIKADYRDAFFQMAKTIRKEDFFENK
jgi:hypothetical protein